MKTAYFTGLRRLELRDEQVPKLADADDVLLRIDRVGVCRSDVHYYVDGRIGNDRVRYPATLGHECAGTVVEVGSSATNVAPGDRVAVDPAIACGGCDQCLAGRCHTCRNLQFMGCPNQAPGVAAEYRVVPARNCFTVPDTMSLDEVALVEPLSVSLHAVRLAAMKPHARAAILGVGPIGLGTLLCVKALVPTNVCATDIIDSRLDMARRCGADRVANPAREDVVALIRGEEPLGLDVVFECSGDPACIDQAQQLLAPGGTLVLVGIPPVVRVEFDAHLMRRKELTLKSVRRQNECVGPAIDLMGSGRLDAGGLVTHHFPLERIQQAFELVADYRDGVIKAMIEVSSDD